MGFCDVPVQGVSQVPVIGPSGSTDVGFCHRFENTCLLILFSVDSLNDFLVLLSFLRIIHINNIFIHGQRYKIVTGWKEMMNTVYLIRKSIVVGVILISIGASIVSGVDGWSSTKRTDVFSRNVCEYENQTVLDGTGDVWSVNVYMNRVKIIKSSRELDVDNLDISHVSCMQQASEVTIRLDVIGRIENRGAFIPFENGSIDDINLVEYDIQLNTSEEMYLIAYCNSTCRLFYDDVQVNLTSSDFSVENSTLSVSFSLVHPDEMCVNLSAASFFIKANLSSWWPRIVAIMDVVPSYLRKVFLFGKVNIISQDDTNSVVEAVNLGMVLFKTFQLIHYTGGERIIFSNQSTGIMTTNDVMIGFFYVFIGSGPSAQSQTTYSIEYPYSATPIDRILYILHLF